MNTLTSVDARLSQDEVRSVYNRIAQVYDLWGTLTETRARERGIELADIRGWGTDFRCGCWHRNDPDGSRPPESGWHDRGD